MNERSQNVAATVNGSLVLFVPVAFVALVTLSAGEAPYAGLPPNVPVPPASSAALVILQATLIMLPLAILAAWRTKVHAIQWRAGQVRHWRGVVEAGVCGFVIALIYLAPGMVTRPRDAPPYVIFYGAAAFVLGVVVGLFLHLTAVLVLKASKSAS